MLSVTLTGLGDNVDDFVSQLQTPSSGPDEDVIRQSAILQLEQFGKNDDRAIGALTLVLQTDPLASLREEAARVLGLLINAPSSFAKDQAIITLGAIANGDPDAAVRATALDSYYATKVFTTETSGSGKSGGSGGSGGSASKTAMPSSLFTTTNLLVAAGGIILIFALAGKINKAH